MKLHRNAKSTPSSRLALVRRVLFEGHSYAEAAAGFGVSTRAVAKWVRRFKDGGVAALEDGSSRPGERPGARTWGVKDGTSRRPGPHLDQNVLGQLRRGSPGLDSWPLRWPLFRCRTTRVLLLGANVALENRD